MTPTERYRLQGASLVEGLFAAEVAAALAYQLSLFVRKTGHSALVPARIGNKACYELYCLDVPILLTLLWGLTPKIEDLIGARLLPSYSYFRTYQSGDICRVHADRAACEHSLSLTLAYADGIAWPLDIATTPVTEAQRQTVRGDEDFGAESSQAFSMAPGDGVLYRGADFRHGRVLANPNRWSAHLFMHWVDRDGPHRSSAFDGRQMAGATDFRFPA